MDYRLEESKNKDICKLLVVALFLGISGYLLWFHLHRFNWILVKEEASQASNLS